MAHEPRRNCSASTQKEFTEFNKFIDNFTQRLFPCIFNYFYVFFLYLQKRNLPPGRETREYLSSGESTNGLFTLTESEREDDFVFDWVL